ncbi:MAG: bifunctional diguanylate cyclase/phosphodiesterase, partial [Acidobacteria bacterium]
ARELEQLRRAAGRGAHVPPRDHFPDHKPDGMDRLTGLPDRDALVRALLGALASGVGPQRRAAVVLLDIDRFRNVNRSFGRARSNVVLQVFARRLAHAAAQSRGAVSTGAGTSTAMAARLGGDRFALLLTGLDDSVDLPALVEQVRRKLAEDYIFGDGSRVHLTASIGVALAPDDAKDAVGLLDCAELAMEEAAEVGDGIVRFHGDACRTWTDRHVRLAGCLAGAVERGELSVHYQPIVEASGGRIVAAEALLRWTSPELGAVSPAEFVPIAEERGLMERIGSWVLDETCRLMSSWRADGMPPLRMSVNVSIGQLIRTDFADTVRAIVERHGVPPPALELEISERGVLRDDPLVRQQLAAVRALGCRLAIDDFGTGNSGVAYLKRFPLTTLKIDRSIVSGVLRSEEDAAITTAITAMARQLQLTVVAEGVETEGQRRFLAICGCDELQGFLFSRPVDASALRELVLARAAHEPVPR